MSDDTKKTAISYVYNFYMDAQNLTNQYATYLSAVLNFKGKYADLESPEAIAGLDDSDKEILLTYANNIRFYITRSLIGYKTLLKHLNRDTDPQARTVIAAAKKAERQLVPECDAIEEYVVALNAFISEEGIQEVFTRNEELISQMFTSPRENNNKDDKS